MSKYLHASFMGSLVTSWQVTATCKVVVVGAGVSRAVWHLYSRAAVVEQTVGFDSLAPHLLKQGKVKTRR